MVNLASLWAGPLAADVLARIGARVINVESTARPDGARHTPRFFEALHGRCTSVALALHTDRGRDQLQALLAAADVVIEGSRPRALEQMGIDAADLVRTGPEGVAVDHRSRPAPTRTANRVGFGDDAAAAGGLVGWIGDDPRFIADAVADPLDRRDGGGGGRPAARVARSMAGRRRAVAGRAHRPPAASGLR